MTITAQTSKTGPYNGNGTTTVFSYTFEVQDEAHLVVTLADASGVETVQVLNTDYTVSGVGNANGGQITMSTAPVVGYTLTISRNIPITQEVDLENRRSVAPEVLEDAYDKLTQIAQDLSEQVGRAIKISVTEGGNPTLTLQGDVQANTFLGFDAAGNLAQLAPASGTFISPNAAIVAVDDFTGDGTTVDFTLGGVPQSPNNLFIFLDGVMQDAANYTVSGTTLTFTTAPPLNTNIEVRRLQAVALTGGTTADLVTYSPAGTGAQNTTVQAKLREFVSVKDFGAVGDGVTDDTAAFNAAFASSQDVFIPAGTYMVSAITVSSPDGLRSVFGVGRDSIIKCSSSGQTVLTVDRANYSGFRDFRILVDAANVTAILITDSAGSTIDDVTTFSTFSNVDVESTGVHLGSTALRIARAIGIRFFGCDFLRTEVGINFSGEAPPNAINFYGCLLRGNGNAYASAGSTNNRGLIIDGNSTSIGFHGCVQEFWSTPSLLNSGNVSFDGNCHFEGAVSGVHIIQEGGNLSVLDSWIDAQRFLINDGVSSVFKHNRVRRATSPVNTFTDDQPAIQLRADVSTRIVVEDNIPVTGNEVVYRPYEYRDPADNLWKPRSKPYWEVANVVPCAFLARLSADISNVTGDGTAYDVVFGTSGVDFDLNGNFDGTSFTAPQNGLYEFSVGIAIQTTVAGNRFVTRLLSTSKDYLLVDRETVATDPTTINAIARVYMKKGETAKINIDVSGASKTTDVLYGTPSTSWTYFSGKLVSGA